jgi:stage II sporulation protein AB (anti-sigma F factor)
MDISNEMRVDFAAKPENEGFARMVISAFILPMNPTLEQMGDVKTSVSEAVTNAIVHGYGGNGGTVRMKAALKRTGR